MVISVDVYYEPETAHGSLKTAPLQAGSSLSIGYNDSGWNGWRYALAERAVTESGQVEELEQDLDVGFLKLILCTTPIDASYMKQETPFDPNFIPSNPRASKAANFEPNSVWATSLIPVIQRRMPAEDGPMDVEQ